MSRRIRNGVLAGLAVMGGLLFTQAPASAAPASPGTSVILAETPAEADQALAANCYYGGWFQFSDGRVVHIIVCPAL